MLRKLIYQQVRMLVFFFFMVHCISWKDTLHSPVSFFSDLLHAAFLFVCLSDVVVLLNHNSESLRKQNQKSVAVTLVLQAEIVTEFWVMISLCRAVMYLEKSYNHRIMVKASSGLNSLVEAFQWVMGTRHRLAMIEVNSIGRTRDQVVS